MQRQVSSLACVLPIDLVFMHSFVVQSMCTPIYGQMTYLIETQPSWLSL